MAAEGDATMTPFVVRRSSSVAFPLALVAAETFMGYIVVYERPAMPELGSLGVGVTTGEAHEDRLMGKYPQYSRAEDIPLQSFIQRLKTTMLTHGASPEAVRLIGELSPFTKKEYDIMAEKLKAKATGDKAGLKEAAKTAPVAGKKGAAATAAPAKEPKEAKPKPDMKERAAAARAARGPVADRKYTPLMKMKDVDLRPETWTRYMVSIILGNKSTDAAREAHKTTGEYGGKSLDFKWAEAKGYIKF